MSATFAAPSELISMRIGNTTVPSSQALTLGAPRAVVSEVPPRDKSVPERRADAPAPANIGAHSDARIRAAVLTPGMSIRGRNAVAAYTQYDLHDQRAQYSALVGVDVYV